MTNEDLKREFVFATYVRNKYDKTKDALVVKEKLHYPDGKIENNLRVIENYVRPFYITKKEYQIHIDKKEYEHLERLDICYSTQCQLANSVFYTLYGYRPMDYVSMYELSSSPFIYGTDIATPVLLAKDYANKYPGLSSKDTLMVMDFEWSVLDNHSTIISGVVSCKETLHIAVTKDFLGTLVNDAVETIIASLNLHLKEYIINRNIKPLVTIADTPGQLVVSLMKTAHKVQPDFLGFWNIKEDMKKLLAALKEDGYDPADVFSDPSISHEYRYFKWREDTPYKITSAGKRTPKHITDMWHVATAPASFTCICLMAFFRSVRTRDGQRSSYKLDDILHEFLNLGKLRFGNVPEGLADLDWHKFMQKNRKIDYMVYMAFDGISCELLDEKTEDVARSARGMLGGSEFAKMKSNPKRLGDDMHFTLLADSKVIGSTSKDMRDDNDSILPSINGWIK